MENCVKKDSGAAPGVRVKKKCWIIENFLQIWQWVDVADVILELGNS